jgi:hypothetical protein
MKKSTRRVVASAIAVASMSVAAGSAYALPGGPFSTWKSSSGAVGNASYGSGSGAFRAKMNCTSNGAVVYGNRIFVPGTSSNNCGPQGLFNLTYVFS